MKELRGVGEYFDFSNLDVENCSGLIDGEICPYACLKDVIIPIWDDEQEYQPKYYETHKKVFEELKEYLDVSIDRIEFNSEDPWGKVVIRFLEKEPITIYGVDDGAREDLYVLQCKLSSMGKCFSRDWN